MSEVQAEVAYAISRKICCMTEVALICLLAVSCTV